MPHSVFWKGSGMGTVLVLQNPSVTSRIVLNATKGDGADFEFFFTVSPVFEMIHTTVDISK
jgi:hypothetical protein